MSFLQILGVYGLVAFVAFVIITRIDFSDRKERFEYDPNIKRWFEYENRGSYNERKYTWDETDLILSSSWVGLLGLLWPIGVVVGGGFGLLWTITRPGPKERRMRKLEGARKEKVRIEAQIDNLEKSMKVGAYSEEA